MLLYYKEICNGQNTEKNRSFDGPQMLSKHFTYYKVF